MITINSQLDMTPGAIPVVIHRSQYDSDFSIVFTLFARMGNFTIASGTTAKVRGTKRSGTGYSADATIDISAKTVTVTGDQQMTVASGQNIFEIVLMSGTKELCSANFILDVERAALDMDTITDDSVIRELDNFDQFIAEAEAAADRAEDAAATFSVDATLTVSGKAADAKAVGDAIASEDKKAFAKSLAAFVTDTATGAIAHFTDGADNIPMKDVLIHIEPVQEGSGDPSPDNVRPITGWTGMTVQRTGKNLLDVDKRGNILPKTTHGITWSKVGEGVYHVSGTSTAKSYFNISFDNDKNPAMPAVGFHGKSLYLSTTNSEILAVPGYIREDESFSDLINGEVLPDEAVAVRAFLAIGAGITIDTDFNIQLEIGSTATAYEPYQGDTYDITFPSEAGTVYGGTLDVTSGVLTVTDAQIASYAGETLPGEWISDRDVYVAGTTPTTGAQVVYKLATPITYTITPQEITSLLGTNNLWADTGDTEVEYRADAKLYITKKITEAVSALS